MKPDVDIAAVPRIALRVEHAAASLGLSRDHFNEHVRPYVKVIHLGGVDVWSLDALKEWAATSGQRPVDALDQRRCHAKRAA